MWLRKCDWRESCVREMLRHLLGQRTRMKGLCCLHLNLKCCERYIGFNVNVLVEKRVLFISWSYAVTYTHWIVCIGSRWNSVLTFSTLRHVPSYDHTAYSFYDRLDTLRWQFCLLNQEVEYRPCYLYLDCSLFWLLFPTDLNKSHDKESPCRKPFWCCLGLRCFL